jgi:glycosyltransferase involved in cell wall biosynthesis
MVDPPADAAPRCAVVIPFYRADRWFGAALASVRAQTRRPASIVVVDDASPPGEARSLDAPGPDVLVLRHAENGGPGAARQTGTEATDTELVAYLDADDWWEPAFLESTIAMLRRHPDVPAVYTAVAKHFADGRRVAYVDKPAILSIREAIVRSHVYPSGLVVRRAALDAVGGWRRNRMVVEDWDLLVRLIDGCGPLRLVPVPLANYRVDQADSVNAGHWRVLLRWRHTVRIDRVVLERHFGRRAPRRRLAQALADRRDRAGGLRGRIYGWVAALLGPPLRDAEPA